MQMEVMMNAAHGRAGEEELGNERRRQVLHQLVIDLKNPEFREAALSHLCKVKKEDRRYLAPVIWFSFGTITTLLKEIVSVYPFLDPPTLTRHTAIRACHAISVFQCVATYPETRHGFISAHMPLYLYAFLTSPCTEDPFEHLRVTTLGILGALIQDGDKDVIAFLLTSELVPLLLRSMEVGRDLSKTVATFIVKKILKDDNGWSYICCCPERFYAIVGVLSVMVSSLQRPSLKLLKQILHCFFMLSRNPMGIDILKQHMPNMITDGSLYEIFREDQETAAMLHGLQNNLTASDHLSSIQ